MNNLKRLLGIFWIVLALAAAYFSVFVFGLPKMETGKQDDLVFGIIVLFVLTPLVVFGLGTFGYYSLKGEYSNEK